MGNYIENLETQNSEAAVEFQIAGQTHFVSLLQTSTQHCVVVFGIGVHHASSAGEAEDCLSRMNSYSRDLSPHS